MIIILGDLNMHYSSNTVTHIDHIENVCNITQLVHQNTRVTGNYSLLINVILTTNPECHQITNVYKLTISDHYLVYTGQL